MEKSFLELLEAEKKVVNDIKFFEESVIDFLNQSQKANSAEEAETWERLSCDYAIRKIEAEEKLAQVRREMKQYISFLITL